MQSETRSISTRRHASRSSIQQKPTTRAASRKPINYQEIESSSSDAELSDAIPSQPQQAANDEPDNPIKPKDSMEDTGGSNKNSSSSSSASEESDSSESDLSSTEKKKKQHPKSKNAIT